MFAAQLYSSALAVPLVISYHTHIPEYIKSYTWQARAKARITWAELARVCCAGQAKVVARAIAVLPLSPLFSHFAFCVNCRPVRLHGLHRAWPNQCGRSFASGAALQT